MTSPNHPRGIYLNEDDPLFHDVNLRYGFAHAMNIDKVISKVLWNDYERLQTMNEGYGDYSNQQIKARSFDLKRADHYFKEAGWGQRGNDGIRVKDGERLAVRVTYVNPAHTPRLVVLKEEARKAGLELNLQLLDASAGFKQILEKKHQVAWMGWMGGGMSPRYWQFFHSENAHIAQTNNITNTDNPQMDQKIDAYRAAVSREDRIQLAHQLEQLVYDTGSVIPTYKVPYTREAFWRWIKLPDSYATRSSTSIFSSMGAEGGLFWIDEPLKEEIMRARRSGKEYTPLYIEDTTWRASP